MRRSRRACAVVDHTVGGLGAGRVRDSSFMAGGQRVWFTRWSYDGEQLLTTILSPSSCERPRRANGDLGAVADALPDNPAGDSRLKSECGA